jgi:ABC-type enterochelin transport system substrate-binding protein
MKANITVEELEQDVEKLLDLRIKKANLEKELKDANEQISAAQDKLRGKLEALEMDSYKGKAGSFSFKSRQGFRVPKDLESKKKFFEYLQKASSMRWCP